MTPIRRLSRAPQLPLLWLAALLTACGGSGGGQRPDPVVLDLPIAYIGRPLSVVQGNEVREYSPPTILDPAAFNPGAGLYLKVRATASAPATNITDQAFNSDALYDVRDLSAHPDGDRLLFSMRAPEIASANDNEQPRWNIWEYDLRTSQLRRIISSDIVAEIGHDLSPRYLPGNPDRILFSSTRQTRSRAVLLDDGKPQYSALEESRNDPAFNLHVMDNDGTNLQQITFNQSHDLQPSVLADGRVLFSRWDRFGNRNNLSLYTVNPDGTQLQVHYGYHSLNGQGAPTLFRPQELPDGRILALMKPRAALYGGVMVAIDTQGFVENQVPTADNGSAAGPALQPLLSLPVNIDGQPSIHGLYGQVHPLADGSPRLLVSWSQCRLQQPGTGRIVPCTPQWLETPGIQEAPPLFGLWIYHMDTETQQPVVVPEENRIYTEVVSFEPRPRPCAYPAPACPGAPRVEGLAEGTGVLHIRSVYDRDGTDTTSAGISALADPAQTPASQRPARFLRLLKAVSIPDQDTLNFPGSAFGVSTQQGMREILGYVPIEPDGSVLVQVPADVAFSFDVVNAQGRRLPGFARHQNWLQLRPGERRDCQGCHSADSTLPHGRIDAEPFPAYAGALGSFANTRREDAFGTPEFPELGETMAEFDARISLICDPLDPTHCQQRGLRTPSLDLLFEDVWTDPLAATPAPDLAIRYADLLDDDYRALLQSEDDPEADPVIAESTALAPASEACQLDWNSLCRTLINYEWHIHPLWERPRYLTEEQAGERVLIADAEGRPVNHTCTSCHARLDSEGDTQVPAASLELIATAATQGRMTSYQHLLAQRLELTLDEGSVVPLQVATGQSECENPALQPGDEGCVEVPIMTTVNLPAPMSSAGANNSQARFFNRFAPGGSHAGWLNPSELRLISEWLDLGAQYYNNPFDAANED